MQIFYAHSLDNTDKDKWRVTPKGCDRSKYFDEIRDVLKNEEHTHGYLKNFRWCANRHHRP